MMRFPYLLRLSKREYYALVEAVRYAQQDTMESQGRLSAALSRVQRKLGTDVGED